MLGFVRPSPIPWNLVVARIELQQTSTSNDQAATTDMLHDRPDFILG